MKPKISENEEHQLELGKVLLDTFINMKNELVLLGQVIDGKCLRSSTLVFFYWLRKWNFFPVFSNTI